jgi:hypothetical protein
MVAEKAPTRTSLAMEESGGGDLRAAEEYAQDGSVDLRGNPVLRSKRGGWKACSFIVGEFVVDLSYIAASCFFRSIERWDAR